MMSHVTIARQLATALLALLPNAHAQDEADGEPEAPGTQPVNEGEILGTQPGPDRALATVDNPYAGDREAITEGRRLFVWFNCYGCHGGRAGGGMGPSLRDVEWLYGNKPADIFDSIAAGRPHGMPAWGLMLPDEQIWKLTAYITALGTELEPDPPPENPVYPDPPPRRDVKGAHGGHDDDESDSE